VVVEAASPPAFALADEATSPAWLPEDPHAESSNIAMATGATATRLLSLRVMSGLQRGRVKVE
jgi:hypothetical protein